MLPLLRALALPSEHPAVAAARAWLHRPRTERVWAAGFAAASQPPGARLQGKEGAEFSARGDASQVLVWARGVWHVDARNTGVDAVLRLVPRQAEAGCAHGAEASTTDAQQVSWLVAGAWLDQRGRSAGTASED